MIPAIMDATIEPILEDTQERVCKSYAPFSGSSLYYTQQIPSITVSINAPDSDIMKNKYISYWGPKMKYPLANKHEDYTIANIIM